MFVIKRLSAWLPPKKYLTPLKDFLLNSVIEIQAHNRGDQNMWERVALISNITFEPYWRMHIEDVFESTVQVDYIPCEEVENFTHSLMRADVIVVCLNFEIFYPNISNDMILKKGKSEEILDDTLERCKILYSFIKSFNCSQIIWFGFEDYFSNDNVLLGSVPAFSGLIDTINLQLIELLEEKVYIDLKQLIARVGILNAYDRKGKYRWNAPYSKETIYLMVEEVYKQGLIYRGITKKCLVLDCDNVLWGGILSEDGFEGIQISGSGLGRPFQDFQRFLLDMYYHGVILTVCSKNDEADVLKVFREHSGMLLNESHISCFCCNWNNKPEGIINISQILNIGLDSMVFVDDSDFEIQSVRSLLPQVVSIKYKRDTVFDKLSCFNLKYKTDLKNVIARVKTYKTNVKRRELQSLCESFDEYLAALEMKIDIHIAEMTEWNRIAELTQRANKCTNGRRYSLEQLRAKLLNEGYRLFSVSLSDKFSDVGIVGAIGLDGNVLDLFCLSCRALGRNVEEKMLQVVKQENICDLRA